jgi:hypothetical protein
MMETINRLVDNSSLKLIRRLWPRNYNWLRQGDGWAVGIVANQSKKEVVKTKW